MAERIPEEQGGVAVEPQGRAKTARPRLYRVLLHNDDFTTMEFVVYILMSIFHKEASEAVKIMLSVHHKGTGLAGVFTCEVARTKVQAVLEVARQYEYPLQCSMEPE